jgi:predicted dienelactone hydrolase
MKVKAIMQALQSHDRVAWIDADVVIVDGSASIFDERGSNWQAIVEHETECGRF